MVDKAKQTLLEDILIKLTAFDEGGFLTSIPPIYDPWAGQNQRYFYIWRLKKSAVYIFSNAVDVFLFEFFGALLLTKWAVRCQDKLLLI